MSTEQLVAAIRDVNTCFLILAQNLIRADREQALYRLGVASPLADHIAGLKPAQMVKVAASNTLLFRPRLQEAVAWGRLCDSAAHAANRTVVGLHDSIVMASRRLDAA